MRFMGLSGSSSSVAKQSSLGSGRGLTYFRACVKSKFYGAFVLNLTATAGMKPQVRAL